MTDFRMPPIRITYDNAVKRPTVAAERKSRVVGMHKRRTVSAWPCDYSGGWMPKRRKTGAEALKMEARSRKRGEASRKLRDRMLQLLKDWERKGGK